MCEGDEEQCQMLLLREELHVCKKNNKNKIKNRQKIKHLYLKGFFYPHVSDQLSIWCQLCYM